jgi:uncharacterized RDD family membrane protein YckC
MNWDFDRMLSYGVMWRRVFGFFLDVILIGLLEVGLWLVLMMLGVLTLGLGFPLLGILPFVPFCYHLFSLAGPMSATPGQAMLGLVVRRNDDLGRPTMLQAVLSTLGFYITLATSGLLLLVALFTIRHRTLHDLVSGLVVVRTRAMETLTPPAGSWNMPGGYPYT